MVDFVVNNHVPTEIKLKREEKLLEISFDDGNFFVFPAEFLRVHSPSAEVQGHSEDQRPPLNRDSSGPAPEDPNRADRGPRLEMTRVVNAGAGRSATPARRPVRPCRGETPAAGIAAGTWPSGLADRAPCRAVRSTSRCAGAGR